MYLESKWPLLPLIGKTAYVLGGWPSKNRGRLGSRYRGIEVWPSAGHRVSGRLGRWRRPTRSATMALRKHAKWKSLETSNFSPFFKKIGNWLATNSAFMLYRCIIFCIIDKNYSLAYFLLLWNLFDDKVIMASVNILFQQTKHYHYHHHHHHHHSGLGCLVRCFFHLHPRRSVRNATMVDIDYEVTRFSLEWMPEFFGVVREAERKGGNWSGWTLAKRTIGLGNPPFHWDMF